jgi:hypothetical protein
VDHVDVDQQQHTYEELREVVVDTLVGEEQVDYQPTQWAQLERLEGQARSLRAGTRGAHSHACSRISRLYVFMSGQRGAFSAMR